MAETAADWGDINQAILGEVGTERRRAHEKHGATSMEASAPDTYRRLAILMEEVGEVAQEFNDAEHDGRPVDLAKLRKELIQVAAMAVAWADACGRGAGGAAGLGSGETAPLAPDSLADSAEDASSPVVPEGTGFRPVTG